MYTYTYTHIYMYRYIYIYTDRQTGRQTHTNITAALRSRAISA